MPNIVMLSATVGGAGQSVTLNFDANDLAYYGAAALAGSLAGTIAANPSDGNTISSYLISNLKLPHYELCCRRYFGVCSRSMSWQAGDLTLNSAGTATFVLGNGAMITITGTPGNGVAFAASGLPSSEPAQSFG